MQKDKNFWGRQNNLLYIIYLSPNLWYPPEKEKGFFLYVCILYIIQITAGGSTPPLALTGDNSPIFYSLLGCKKFPNTKFNTSPRSIERENFVPILAAASSILSRLIFVLKTNIYQWLYKIIWNYIFNCRVVLH